MTDLEAKIAKHLHEFFGMSVEEAQKFAREAALISEADRAYLFEHP
jgi:hypothetical protein